MIRFSDVSYTKDNVEKLSGGFKDIKPLDGMTKSKADTFWNNVFDEKFEDRYHEFSSEELYPEIFSRSEEEFTFDFDIDEDIQNVMDKFSDDKWNLLDDAEKKQSVKELSSVISDKLGLKELPNIKFFEEREDYCGSYNITDNSIAINSKTFNNPKEVINTVAHELRHAYQYQRAGMLETHDDYLYKLNFENYIAPTQDKNGNYINFFDYQDQFVEAEARAFANIFEV